MRRVEHSNSKGFLLQTLLSAVLCCVCAGGAFAIGRFDSWATEDGLPQNSINDIAITRQIDHFFPMLILRFSSTMTNWI